jgi:hypothetical protein
MPDVDMMFIALGAVGGLLPDAIRFAKQRQEGFPEWFRKIGYWVGLLVLVALGAFAAWLGQATNWQSALAMGFGAPELISRVLGSEKAQDRGNGFPVRRWWGQ